MADRVTEIGPASLVAGDIDATEDVAVFGRVEGVIRCTEVVTVEEDGVVQGEIESATVVVAGVVIGDIRATSRVEILETGAVKGNISTPTMVLIDGGAVQGRLIMDDSDPEPVKVATSVQRRTGSTRTASTSAGSSRTASRSSSRTRPAASAKTEKTSVRSTRSQSRRAAAAREESVPTDDDAARGSSDDLLESNE